MTKALELPSKLPHVQLLFLQTLQQGGLPSYTADDLKTFPFVAALDPKTISNYMQRMLALKYIKAKKSGYKNSYSLTALGSAILANIDQITITNRSQLPAGKSGKPKKQVTATLQELQPVQTQLNLSVAANNLKNLASDVIADNHSYREFLLQTARTLAAFLDMELIPKQPQPTNNEDA